MIKTRLIAAASAVALSFAALSAPAFAATAMKHTKSPVHKVAVVKKMVVKKKVHAIYASGTIVGINAPAAMITLSNGKTYRLINAKDIGKYKVGHHVRLRIG